MTTRPQRQRGAAPAGVLPDTGEAPTNGPPGSRTFMAMMVDGGHGPDHRRDLAIQKAEDEHDQGICIRRSLRWTLPGNTRTCSPTTSPTRTPRGSSARSAPRSRSMTCCFRSDHRCPRRSAHGSRRWLARSEPARSSPSSSTDYSPRLHADATGQQLDFATDDGFFQDRRRGRRGVLHARRPLRQGCQRRPRDSSQGSTSSPMTAATSTFLPAT